MSRTATTLLVTILSVTAWCLPSVLSPVGATGNEPVTVVLEGPESGYDGHPVAFSVVATSAGDPVAGLDVAWYRSGDDSGDDAVPDAITTTGDDGRALHEFVGRAGVVDVRAVVTDGAGTVLLNERRAITFATVVCRAAGSASCAPEVRVRMTGRQGRHGRDVVTVTLTRRSPHVPLDRRIARLLVRTDGTARQVGPRKMFGADLSVTWAIADERPRRTRRYFVDLPYGGPASVRLR